MYSHSHTHLHPQVSFNKDGELVLDPTGSAFRHAVEKALSDAVRVTDVVPRLLEHEALSPYTTAAEYEAPEDEAGDLHDVVEAEPSFQKERTALFAGMRRAFQRVSEYCTVFEPYRVRALGRCRGCGARWRGNGVHSPCGDQPALSHTQCGDLSALAHTPCTVS